MFDSADYTDRCFVPHGKQFMSNTVVSFQEYPEQPYGKWSLQGSSRMFLFSLNEGFMFFSKIEPKVWVIV